MKCVYCPDLEEARRKGMRDGYCRAALSFVVMLLAAGYLFPEAFAWLVARTGGG